MRIGVTKFPGTNNEQDVLRALSSFGIEGELIREYDTHIMREIDALILAGGFSFGDYLRPGIIAANTPIMEQLADFVGEGRFVIGICNGFQILCETHILPGVLTTNTSTKFICKWVHIKVENNSSPLLKGLKGQVLHIPIAHFEGNYYNTSKGIEALKQNNQIAFRYCDEEGNITKESNPNGSLENIAGIVNKQGNILGMMPHPERASFNYLGSVDGRIIFQNLIEELK
ncbi:MAG: phosphoribosylformylglycinamidine synthase I [Candidatus Heimdallarchaeaceae archaeon]